jgi:hypothetical protein
MMDFGFWILDLQIVEVAEGLAKSSAKFTPMHGNVEEKPNLFKEGQLCEAYYTGDKLWYPAKVVSVSNDGLLYTVKWSNFFLGNKKEFLFEPASDQTGKPLLFVVT